MYSCLTSFKQEKNNQRGIYSLYLNYIINKYFNTNSQGAEPDWMKDYEDRKVAKETATKLKVSYIKYFEIYVH